MRIQPLAESTRHRHEHLSSMGWEHAALDWDVRTSSNPRQLLGKPDAIKGARRHSCTQA
jgi:hypothetical protein